MTHHALSWANLKESLLMAFSALRVAKLRSALTLLGIIVGVFSIISVMTAVGALRNSIEDLFSQLGANTVKIQKYDVEFHIGPHRHRWRNRRNITYRQAKLVQERSTLTAAVGIEVYEWSKTVVWRDAKTNPNIALIGYNPDAFLTNDMAVEIGRGVSPQEEDQADMVAILGKNVANKIFPPNIYPVGEQVRVDGSIYRVIGIFEKKGGALGGQQDNFVVVPLTTFFRKYGQSMRSMSITVKARGPEVFEDAVDEARAILRAARNVPPGEEDDFGIISNDSLITQFNDITYYVRLGILVVSSIALLAAGIGIMNIMLVSVTERTHEIGIRKAVGATRGDILSQFLAEAIILSQMGGLIGIVLGVLGGNVVGLLLDIPAVVPWEWVLIGVTVCTMVGVVFGVYPAWKAASLDPIESLRFE